ncbi:MAG: isochorismatase family protein [Nannocystaceae bacterium]
MSADAPIASALVVVDLQNDLVDPAGAYPRRHVEPWALVQAIAWVADLCRQQDRPVVWVRARYGELGDDPGLRGRTHLGGPCCVRGTWGAEPPETIASAVAASDWILDKQYYSAFEGTDLEARLRAAGIGRVLLAGVATNVCVLATARDARARGFEVVALADACAAGTSGKHTAALREITALGGEVRSWVDLAGELPRPVEIRGLGAGGTTLVCGGLHAVIDDPTFAALEAEIEWSSMLHRGGEVPRLVALQGDRTGDDAEPLYRHPADGQPPLAPWTSTVDRIRLEVQKIVGHPLNHGLLQLYRSGRDFIREHADKTLDVARPSRIVNVSIGRRRTMVLRPKDAPSGAPARLQKIPLPSGSCLLMDLETNRRFAHAIRQEGASDDDGPRISLTFRHIGTWWDPETRAVWGSGGRTRDRQEAEAHARARAALPELERAAWERAEAERLLILFRAENLDPDFDVAAYAEGFEVVDFRSLQRE